MGETAIQKPPTKLLEVWESLPEGTYCQIINNSLVMSPAPLNSHQKVLGKIFARLLAHIEKNNLGEVYIAPCDVHFDEKNIYQPDLTFVSRENEDRIMDRGIKGSPDLIIEVLSPSNQRFDKVDKKDIYEKYGVKEYFIVDPSDKSVLSYLLVNDEFVQRESKSGTIESQLLGATFTF